MRFTTSSGQRLDAVRTGAEREDAGSGRRRGGGLGPGRALACLPQSEAAGEGGQIENENDRSVAEDGMARVDPQIRERIADRLDDDFLHVLDRVDAEFRRPRGRSG